MPTQTDGVSGLLSRYQTLLLDVINEPDVPGVSSRDLEAFRNEFCTSAHTCRLRSCPRATVGFETKALRIEHEVSHVRRYPCTHAGCRYPPFLTQRSLREHIQKEHDIAKTPKPLRRIKTTVNREEHRLESNTLAIPPIPPNGLSTPRRPLFDPRYYQTQQSTVVKQEDKGPPTVGKLYSSPLPAEHMPGGMVHYPPARPAYGAPSHAGSPPIIPHHLAHQMAVSSAGGQLNSAPMIRQ